ncbi:MAG: VWA domain-containing protein [Candidatus Acidiferrales bacterium]
MRSLFQIAILLGLTLPLAPRLSGQQNPPSQADDFRVQVRVERVTAPLVVRDRDGEFVYDLRREEVQLLDKGVPQQIQTFEVASGPISLVILIDTSQRVAPLLDRVRPAGVLFTSYILGQQGEAAVVTFDTDVALRQEFTSDPEMIIRAVQDLRPGGGHTRLADGLDRAVGLLAERAEGRRGVIVAITEARDEGSVVQLGMPLRRAQLLGISVYTITLSALDADLVRKPEDRPVPQSPYPPGVFPRPGVPGQVQTPTTEAQREYSRVDILAAVTALVKTLTETRRESVNELYAAGTGGLHFSPHSREAVEQAINRIGQDLHNQYIVTYRPSNQEEEGFHAITMRVSRPDLRLRHRPGYYVGPPL